jgi:glutaredoxin
MIRYVRIALGKIFSFFDRVSTPASRVRPLEYQARVDRETAKLALYDMEYCPFCIKTRRAIKQMGLKIESRDVQKNPKFKDELIREGGMLQAPCLRIVKDDESVQWMYESSDIIRYLNERYAE